MDIVELSNIVSGLATAGVLTMDLGVDYSPLEKTVYTHPLFQILAVFCMTWLTTNKVNTTLVVVTIWMFLKYYKF